MKKITYMLLAGALLCSCADEKPHFLPAPGGTVEIGGIGATPSSDAAALLDDDLTTYFEAEVGSENSVEAVVDCSAGRIVAYTLVSSGVVEQGDNGVEALYDPVSWKVYGSDDGASWNEVDSRSEVAFIARFQKHIYYLAAPADYAKYKFVFKANGGDKLTLSDILFHTEDPYAAWKNFESPEILFIDLAEDKGSKLYDVLVQDKIAYLKWHALEICTYLYFNDRDERFPVNTIEYFLEPMPGEVSYKGGAHGGGLPRLCHPQYQRQPDVGLPDDGLLLLLADTDAGQGRHPQYQRVDAHDQSVELGRGAQIRTRRGCQ